MVKKYVAACSVARRGRRVRGDAKMTILRAGSPLLSLDRQNKDPELETLKRTLSLGEGN